MKSQNIGIHAIARPLMLSKARAASLHYTSGVTAVASLFGDLLTVSIGLPEPCAGPRRCRYVPGQSQVLALPTINHEEPDMTTRDAYIAKMKLQLDELNAKITELEAKGQEAKDDARAKYQEEMKKLRKQSSQAMAKLDEIKTAGEDRWESLVTEMEKVRDAFKHSFNYFKSQL